MKTFFFFFFGEHLPLVSLALASSIPVLGLESVCPRKGCPWPWPRIFFVSLALASSLVSSTPPLETDIAKLYKEKSCSSVEKVLTYCPKKWLEDRPKPIVECFAKLCNQDPSSEIGSYSIAKAIEQTYNARNSRLVLPLSFRHNLVSYSFTGSKQLVKLYSSSSPSGSYTFITNWLSQNAKIEITFPERTVRVVFDNEQAVGKRYTVNVENFGVPISVITSRGGVEDTRLEAKAKDTKKNPRPRTAFPRTDPLETKDRNARGQGQGPMTQLQVFSEKKKVFKKSLSGNLQFIGVARIFDWGGLNHKSRAMTSSKICLLALNQNFAKREGLNKYS